MPIDIHAHYVPRQLIEAVKANGAEIGVRLIVDKGETPAIGFDYGFSTRPLFPKLIESAQTRRQSLERQGLDRQLLATWPDMYGYGLAPASCVAWHRMLNDTLAEWCVDHADRFSWVASVPLGNETSAASELARAADVGAVAVMLPANVEGTNIGELRLEALWAAAAKLVIPVILHPVLSTPAPRSAKFGLTQIVQYTFDTTLGAGSLMMSGVLDRHPHLTLILSHGGGALPYLVGRFDIMATRMDVKAQAVTAADAPSDYVMRMAYDTIVHSPKVLRFLADIAGLDRLAIGTDESFPPADHAPLESLRAAGFSSGDIGRIGEENPRRLIPRLNQAAS
jgi:aminocarboxymuconate-semialdehyde decarboxylase